MSENNLEIPESSFFSGFNELTTNKHFWMVIFVLASIATGYYYYNNYINKTEPKQQTDDELIQELIKRGVITQMPQQPVQNMQAPQMMQQPVQNMQAPQMMQQPVQQPVQPVQPVQQQLPQQQVPEVVEGNDNVQEQNLTQEELNMIKQQLEQASS